MNELCDFTDAQLTAELQRREEDRTKRLGRAQEALLDFVRHTMVQPSDLGVAVADQVRTSLGLAGPAMLLERQNNFEVTIVLRYTGDRA